MNQLFTSGDQSIGASASASVLLMNIQDWFPLGLTGLILLSKGLSRVFSSTTIWKRQFFSTQPSLRYNCHISTWVLEKTIALTIRIFVSKVISLLFNILFRLVIAFLPRSKHLLISWLQSPATVILEPKKTVTVSTFSPSFAMKWWNWMPWSSFLECWVLSQLLYGEKYFYMGRSYILQKYFLYFRKYQLPAIKSVIHGDILYTAWWL